MRWLVIIALGAGCGGGQDSPPAAPELSPAQSTLDFGDVSVGEGCPAAAPQELTFSYTGGETDSLDVGPTPQGFSVDVKKNPANAGQFIVTVTFKPTKAGAVDGDIVLSAPGGVKAAISVGGSGVEASYDTDPPELDFGAVLIATNKTLQLTLHPLCGAGGHVEISSDEPMLTIAPTSLDFPQTDGVVDVTFTPLERGAIDGAHISINYCATCVPLTREVKGIGAIEDFTLDPTPLDFGQHDQGTLTCVDETVRNTGDVPISLNSLMPDATFRAGGAFALDTSAMKTDLDPNATTTFKVCFQPPAAGVTYSGKINMTTTTNKFGSLSVTGRS